MTKQQQIDLATATAKRDMGIVAFEKFMAGEPWPHATKADRAAMAKYISMMPR